MRFAAPSTPTIWPPSRRPVPGSHDELDPDRPGAGEVARARRVLDLGRDDLDARVGRLALGDPGARDLVAAQPRHGGPDDAGEREVAAGRVRARDAALLVGVRAELDVHRPLEDAVPGLGAVARGVDAVVARAALVVVDAHARRSAPSSSPASSASADRRLDAGRHHDVVGVDRLAAGPHRARRARRRAGPPRPSSPTQHATPRPSAASWTWAAMSASSVPMTCGAASISVVGDVALDERLGHLEADVAAADDDDVLVLAAARQRRAEALGGVDGARPARLASAPGIGGGTASAPVARTSSSKPSRALLAGLVVEDRERARRRGRSPMTSVRMCSVDPVRAVLVGASG